MEPWLEIAKIVAAGGGAYVAVRVELRLLWAKVDRIEQRLDSLFVHK